jgi:hypothetical protein
MSQHFRDTMTDKMDVVIDWIMDHLALFWSGVVIALIASVFLISGAVTSLIPGYSGTGTITAATVKGDDCYVTARLDDGTEGEFPFGHRWKCSEKEVAAGKKVTIAHGKATDSFLEVLKSVVQ